LKLPFTANQIPPLDSFDTTLPEMRTKRAEFHIQQSKLRTDCAIIRKRLQASPSNASNEQENKVRQLLGKPPLAETLSDLDQLKANQNELEIIGDAISTLDAEILKRSRGASNKMIEFATPELNRRGSAFANAFDTLRAKHLEYDDFLDSLENAGASIGQFRLKPNGLDHPKQLSGNYFYGLEEFAHHGFFSKSTLQKVFE
jgi:hypothetical protein